MPEDSLLVIWMMIGMSCVLTVTTLGFYKAWRDERRARAARIEKLLGALDTRIETLTESVDTVQLEVERLGELERFATKLLMANGQRAGDGRVITPH